LPEEAYKEGVVDSEQQDTSPGSLLLWWTTPSAAEVKRGVD